ncbi:syntaxin 19 L homeolog [Xenopus laevis]|uniref:Syntaxin-19 n=1 Tax=Xenopus laevis TaxID=8355 RepID=Q63ZQ8_XENLA|nr:syntaxin 19 L homeolog [Xenopus laevis]AAH82852.1 LOC494752 protein [Xenopus laevis]
MRDRLEEFLQKAKELELCKETESSLVDQKEPDELQQQAVIFEREPVVDSYLHEIQKLKNEINELSNSVTKFGQEQKVLVSSMRRFSVMKREDNITKVIRVQAENIKRRLDSLSQVAKKFEVEHGPTSGVTRILKGQHSALFGKFQSIMLRYNETIASKQSKCKTFIIRQLEVAGKEVSEEEVNKMVEQGKWDVFNENLLTEVKITRTQLTEIEQRHKELVSLENQMNDLKDIFLQIFLLVEEQGGMINNIEVATQNTENYVQQTTEKFKLAAKYKRKNPCRVLCCCCFPCCK